MVVWESVPTTVSGKAVRVPSGSGRAETTSARYSRLTWWTMPVPGGTTRKFANASWAQRRSAYRSPLRSYSRSTLIRNAASDPYWSTWTEWSITRSAGTSGLICAGSPPISAIASRMAARSTTTGTPVKSWSRTRAGRNGSSVVAVGCVRSPRREDREVVGRDEPAPRRRVTQRVLDQDLERVRESLELGNVERAEVVIPIRLLADVQGSARSRRIGRGRMDVHDRASSVTADRRRTGAPVPGRESRLSIRPCCQWTTSRQASPRMIAKVTRS